MRNIRISCSNEIIGVEFGEDTSFCPAIPLGNPGLGMRWGLPRAGSSWSWRSLTILILVKLKTQGFGGLCASGSPGEDQDLRKG